MPGNGIIYILMPLAAIGIASALIDTKRIRSWWLRIRGWFLRRRLIVLLRRWR